MSGPAATGYMRPLILGIDPGKKGALAWIEVDTRGIVALEDMPASPRKIRDALTREDRHHSTRFAVVEDVSAMTYTTRDGQKRGQGAKASFTFGFDAGVTIGMLEALSIPVFFVKPATWKMIYGLSSNKEDSLRLARKRFPSHAAALFSRSKDDGRAEAALLALFGAERFL